MKQKVYRVVWKYKNAENNQETDISASSNVKARNLMKEKYGANDIEIESVKLVSYEVG